MSSRVTPSALSSSIWSSLAGSWFCSNAFKFLNMSTNMTLSPVPLKNFFFCKTKRPEGRDTGILCLPSGLLESPPEAENLRLPFFRNQGVGAVRPCTNKVQGFVCIFALYPCGVGRTAPTPIPGKTVNEGSIRLRRTRIPRGPKDGMTCHAPNPLGLFVLAEDMHPG